MCPVCSITTKLSDVLAKLRTQRKRDRIYKQMQKQQQRKTYTPAIHSGIETYNLKGGE